MREDQAAALVAALLAAWPHYAIGAETLQLYTAFLSDVDESDAAVAVTTWIAREKRFPYISELREACEKARGGNPPDIDQAWREVFNAARSGRIPSKGWSHAAVRLAVAAVGFDDIRRSDNASVTMAHFAKAYEAAKRRTTDSACAQLVEVVVPSMRRLMEAPSAARTHSEAQRALPPVKPKDVPMPKPPITMMPGKAKK